MALLLVAATLVLCRHEGKRVQERRSRSVLWLNEHSSEVRCINNLRQIENAKESYAAACSLTNGTSLAEADVQNLGTYIKGGWANLSCTTGATYAVGLIGKDPSCSVHGTLTMLSEALRRRKP